MPQPQTRYARAGEMYIAYQVVGEGPIDLVYTGGFVTNVDLCWDFQEIERFLNRLASFGRLFLFDRRGTGMSDRVPAGQLPSLVMHRSRYPFLNPVHAAFLQQNIAGALSVGVEGADALYAYDRADEALG